MSRVEQHTYADEHMLKYNPINDYIYSGNDGGLYVSTDNGDNWTDISDGLQITQFIVWVFHKLYKI